MARMQYRGAARRRGFQTQQLSTAGIARMREESNRVVQHMEKTRIAEKQERDKLFESMKEDADYTRRIRQENQETLLRNTETEFKQEMANIEGAAKQAMEFAQAPLNILQSIAEFSQTARAAEEDRKARELKEAEAAVQHRKVKALDVNQFNEYVDAQKKALQAGEVLATLQTINAVEGTEDPLDTIKGYLSNPATSGEERRLLDNKHAFSYYEQIINPVH